MEGSPDTWRPARSCKESRKGEKNGLESFDTVRPDEVFASSDYNDIMAKITKRHHYEYDE